MTTDKLSIANEMAQFDSKNRDFYDDLTEEERKKFSPFLMIRYGATVKGNTDLEAYYLISCNERLNRNFFDINTTQHKKLQWLLATTVSPGMGRQFHQWIAPKKKDTGNNRVEKLLRELYPDLRDDEIALLARLNTRDDLQQHLKSQGWDDRRIKEYL
jgi:hypothetical protein